LGIEGGGWEKNILSRNLSQKYESVYEINPLFTKQRRSFGTRSARRRRIFGEVGPA